jgi:hypothetical protein
MDHPYYQQQIQELELLRSWASQVGLGQARDHIALAIHAIREDAKRFEKPKDRYQHEYGTNLDYP